MILLPKHLFWRFDGITLYTNILKEFKAKINLNLKSIQGADFFVKINLLTSFKSVVRKI